MVFFMIIFKNIESFYFINMMVYRVFRTISAYIFSKLLFRTIRRGRK